jgi:glycosyltransferase involved in cell wall biosynthesis
LQQDLRVSVINLTRHRRPDGEGAYFPGSPWQVLSRIASLRPDLLHIHCGGSLTRELLGLFIAAGWWPATKSVLTFHSGGYPTSESGQRARPGSWPGIALRQLDHLIAVNGAIREVFLRYGVPRERTSVIEPHSGVSRNGRAELPPLVERFAATHQPLLVTVGLLETEYNLPLQMEALRAVRTQQPAAGLVIVGSGSLDASLRGDVAAFAEAPHVLLCGDLPHEVTLSLIQRAALLLRTTSYDGDSIAVREALQLGTPVLASDNGMRPPGVFLLSELAAPALAREVLRLVAPPAGRRFQLGVSESLGDENLRRVLEVYRRLLPDHASTPGS